MPSRRLTTVLRVLGFLYTVVAWVVLGVTVHYMIRARARIDQVEVELVDEAKRFREINDDWQRLQRRVTSRVDNVLGEELQCRPSGSTR